MAISLEKGSQFPFQPADLQEEVDIYSQEKIKTIQTERFKKNLDLYIGLIEEGKSTFVFEGSRFTEEFIRNCQKNVEMRNPSTRRVIHSFQIFKYNKQLFEANQKPAFVQVIDKNTLACRPDIIPILWSDHTRTDGERGKFYFIMGSSYHTGKNCQIDIATAITYYRKGAVLGYRDAQYNLSLLLAEKGQPQESLYWALKYWQQASSISVKGLLQISFAFEDCDLFEKAFLFYKQAAYQKSPYAIGKVIYYYERALGVDKNLEKALLWRQSLPISWQKQEIETYLNYVGTANTSVKIEGDFHLKIEAIDPPPFPDPDQLLPEVKKKIQENTVDLYLSK